MSLFIVYLYFPLSIYRIFLSLLQRPILDLRRRTLALVQGLFVDLDWAYRWVEQELDTSYVASIVFLLALMDSDAGLGFRNWGYIDQPLKQTLGLQLMSSVADRDILAKKSVIQTSNYPTRNPSIPECGVPISSSMEFPRDNWMNQRDLPHTAKHFEMFSGNPNFESKDYSSVLPNPQTNNNHVLPIMPPEMPQPNQVMPLENPPPVKTETQSKKKQGNRTLKVQKPKKPKVKAPKEDQNGARTSTNKSGKKNWNAVIKGIPVDIAGIPIPVCSCTGVAQQCYRWGCGGWQSACCTTQMSMYPLPMSQKRRGARIAGRKMSGGAFIKVLEKVAADGHDLSKQIDLKTHWAKHGTNKFVTIK
ncbi:protein BASIC PENTACYSTEINE2 [Amborella trichopoda]|uniref:GAGA-binding transcriptional activator n=1 Tax=Amborella trichopoda TaxID=13333 RepID=W1PSM8_AMBTC|nr:protein BASIC PENTACYSTEINE2 [Amborella trichopoda]ERN11048.1 hypothetical protein AMTR_s00024p00090860 [Amborella trichopoda]|eukprot:XP_006849467.3 protein BASIC PENTACYSTEINE2 [Amborella trichopoda]